MINYLNSLINLEFSVIQDNISNSDRITLFELEVYKRIAMYNVYKSNKSFFYFYVDKSKLRKTLVKRLPSITIKNNIKYI